MLCSTIELVGNQLPETQHENISFREVIGFIPTQEPYLSHSTWQEYFEELMELRKVRKNINIRVMPDGIDECLIIADQRYALMERSQPGSIDDRKSEKREVQGGLVLDDPEGTVATGLAKEFATFWNTGSWELL